MRKSLRYGAVAVLLLGVVGVVLPSLLIDKDAIKRRLARAVYESTGRELAIDGAIGFSMLPLPHFSAEDVRLSNWPDSAEPWMVSIRRVMATVSPLDLLRGNVVARTLELDTPNLLLERRAGRGNWSFVAPGQLPPRPEAAPVETSAPAEAAVAALAVAFSRVVVRDGRVVYRDANGDRSVTVGKLSAQLEAQTVQGPFQLHAQAVVGGQAATLDGTVGRIQPGRAVTLRFDAGVAPARLHLDGLLLRAIDEGSVLKAAAELTAPDAEVLAARFGVTGLSGLSGQAVSLSGQTRMTAVGGELADGLLRLGSSEATAKLAWELDGARPKLSATIKTRRIDLDAWTAPRAAHLDDAVPGRASSAIAVARAAESPAVLTPPRGFDLDLSLAADAVIWHGQAVQTAVCDIAFSRGDLVVNQASAELPGAAQVRAFGFVGADAARRNVDLTVQAGAANLRGLLDWLGVDVGAVPSDRLRKAGLTAVVTAVKDGLLQVRDIDLLLDASRGKGALDLRWGERPAFGLSLSVDQVNVDAYREDKAGDDQAAVPVVRAIPVAAQDVPATKGTASTPPMWDRFDANLDVRVGRLTMGGQPLDRVAARGRWQGELLDVAALSAEIGGEGRLAASGRIAAKGEGAPRFDAVKAEITTPRADRLLGLWPVSLPGFVRDWRALSASLSVDGPVSDFHAEAAVAVSDTRFGIAGRFDGLRRMPTGDGDISISAPTLAALAATFGAEVAPELARKGAVEIYVPLNGDAHGYAIPALTATADDIALGGELTVKTDGPRPHLTARLKGNLLPLFSALSARASAHRGGALAAPRVVPAAAMAEKTPGAGSAAWWMVLCGFDGDVVAAFDAVVGKTLSAEAVTLTARLDDGILTLDEATAKVLGGNAGIKGKADLRALPKLTATVDAKDVAIDAKSPLFAGNAPLAGRVTLKADGDSVGGDAETLLRGMNGKGEVTIRDGSFAGVDLGAVNDRLGNVKSLQDMVSAIEAGGRGRTAFTALTGHFTAAGGVVRSDDLKMMAPSGLGEANGTVDLAARRINAVVRFALASLKDAPPLGLKLQGAWESPRVFFETGDFQGYMIQKGLGRFLKGLTKKGAAKKSDEPPPPAKLKPKDVLREALDAIPAR